jgi:hypothetical protein
MLVFFLFACYDKKKKGKGLNREPIGKKGNLSDCQSLVSGRLPGAGRRSSGECPAKSFVTHLYAGVASTPGVFWRDFAGNAFQMIARLSVGLAGFRGGLYRRRFDDLSSGGEYSSMRGFLFHHRGAAAGPRSGRAVMVGKCKAVPIFRGGCIIRVSCGADYG